MKKKPCFNFVIFTVHLGKIVCNLISKNYIVGFLFFLFSSSIFAQYGKELDALLLQVKDASYYDSSRVFTIGEKTISIARQQSKLSAVSEVYLYYGSYFFYVRNLSEAESYFKKAISTAEETQNEHIALRAKIRLAYLDFELGQKEKSLEQLNYLLEIAKSKNDFDNQAEAINLIGIIKEYTGNAKEAMVLYYEGLILSEKNNLKYYPAVFRNNLGLIKLNADNNKAAYEDFVLGLAIAEKDNDKRLASHIQMNICILNVRENKLKEAFDSFSKVIDYSKKNNLPVELSSNYINMATAFVATNPATAIDYYDSAIVILEKHQLVKELNRAYLGKVDVLFQLKKIAEAEKILASVEPYFLKNQSSEEAPFYYFQLYRVNEQKGDFKNALANFITYTDLKTQLENKLNNKVIEQLQQNYTVQQKEIELEKEKTKTILLEKQNQEHRFVLWFSISLAGLIIILIGVFFYIKYTRRIKEEQQLFSQQLISNIEEERKRIARDLHDDIGQSLSFIKSKIVNEKSKNSELILSLEKELGAVIEQTREISHGLYPSSLEKIGLARSVAALMTAVQNSTNLECSFDIADEVQQLTILVQTHLFRILQECVNNTLKHSNASGLKIVIEKKGNEFTLTYQDNGKSAKSKKKMDGIGLLSIKERANIIGAMIHANDITEKGFKLVLKFK